MKRRTSLYLMGSMVTGFTLALKPHPYAAEPPTYTPVRSRFDVEKLEQLLDRKDVTGAIQLVEQGWKQQYEEYYRGELTLRLLSTETISQRLQTLFRQTGKRSALIYAIPAPNHLELIFLAPGETPVHRRVPAAHREVLLQTVKALREGIVLSPRTASRYLTPGQQIYQWLISPLESDLRANRIDTLVFCLGSGLRTVPLAALHDGNQFLIEKYNLGIIPAFNLVDHRPVSLRNAKVLAMGASEFDDKPPLPSVPLELTAIATNLWTGDVLLNQDFTPANLRSYRQKQLYRIVHLATHADFAPGSISSSYIQFWDQRLSIDLVQNLSLRFPEVQLLVLSACQTAIGDLQAELGFAGLAIMSGCRAALASLWQVSDVGTLLLMTEFYRQLKTANKSEALRQAQIALLTQKAQSQSTIATVSRANSIPVDLETIQNADFSHPYFWAAFTVIGNAW
ncbi:MAG: CHAT domain-containing protein [Leptolyngbyaceae cyanobacterium bins.302]|nr:CHAT domain-containing protein [Leptolyngbyaceae cyanobacterium bins.302]